MKLEQVKCCLNMRCKNRAACIHGIKYDNVKKSFGETPVPLGMFQYMNPCWRGCERHITDKID